MKIIENKLWFNYNNEDIVLDMSHSFCELNHNDTESYVIMLTNKCNMTCGYCFEKEIKNVEYKKEYCVHDLVAYLTKRGKKKYQIRFLGGEPLLNKPLLFECLDAFDKMRIENNVTFKYNIITNGTLIDYEVLDYFKKYDVFVILSFDGSREMHNKNRKFANGMDTYDTCLNSINMLKEYDRLNKLVVHMVYDIDSGVPLWDNLTNIANMGIYVSKFVFPYVPKNSNYAIDNEKIIKIKEQINICANNYLNYILQGKFRYMFSAFSNYIYSWVYNCFEEEVSSCEAGNSYFTINCNGDIFPCQSLIDYKGFIIGDIYTGIFKKTLQTKNMYFPTCQKCELRNLCRLRCPADNYILNGDPYKVNRFRCEIQKEIFKASAYIYSKLREHPIPYKYVKRLLNNEISEAAFSSTRK